MTKHIYLCFFRLFLYNASLDKVAYLRYLVTDKKLEYTLYLLAIETKKNIQRNYTIDYTDTLSHALDIRRKK